MGNFQRLLSKHRLDYGTFNVWASQCEKRGRGAGKRALDAYQASLRKCELYESALQTWMMRHVYDSDFEAGLRAKGQRLEELEAESVARLRRVFDLFLRDVRKS
jgi:hypothetical protein